MMAVYRPLRRTSPMSTASLPPGAEQLPQNLPGRPRIIRAVALDQAEQQVEVLQKPDVRHAERDVQHGGQQEPPADAEQSREEPDDAPEQDDAGDDEKGEFGHGGVRPQMW